MDVTEAILFEGKFSVSFGPNLQFRLWIWTWTKLNNIVKLSFIKLSIVELSDAEVNYVELINVKLSNVELINVKWSNGVEKH